MSTTEHPELPDSPNKPHDRPGSPQPSLTNSVDDIVEEIIDLFRDEETGNFSVNAVLKLLKDNGIGLDDPRLADMLQMLNMSGDGSSKPTSAAECFERAEFKKALMTCMALVSKVINKQMAVPEWPKFCDKITEIFTEIKPLEGGKNADYIPELARVDPKLFGIAVCSTDGQRHSSGDTSKAFCIQSISKAFNYAINLNDLGPDLVHKRIGTEPSGRLFNEIVLDKQKKPHNPMINAGAIVCSSLVRPQLSQADRFSFIIEQYSRIAGGGYIGFSNATFLSERDTADRNYALTYYMREHGNFDADADIRAILEFYFQLCSVLVTAESLSVMAATLANGGICPTTGEQVLSNEACRHTLSLMHSCGMYDYSGMFAFRVGLPAKSGVGGGIVVVVPNLCGFCTFSPPLDKIGNSFKGVKFYEELVKVFNFHNFDNMMQGAKYDPRNKFDLHPKIDITSVLLAVKKGDMRTVRGYVLRGVDMNEADYDGRTALHIAASEGHTEIITFLLDRCKVFPSPIDRWGHTPYDDTVVFDTGDHKCTALLNKYKDQPLDKVEE